MGVCPYPGTLVIRLSARIGNTGATPRTVSGISFSALLFSAQDDLSLRWMAGGNPEKLIICEDGELLKKVNDPIGMPKRASSRGGGSI